MLRVKALGQNQLSCSKLKLREKVVLEESALCSLPFYLISCFRKPRWHSRSCEDKGQGFSQLRPAGHRTVTRVFPIIFFPLLVQKFLRHWYVKISHLKHLCSTFTKRNRWYVYINQKANLKINIELVFNSEITLFASWQQWYRNFYLYV